MSLKPTPSDSELREIAKARAAAQALRARQGTPVSGDVQIVPGPNAITSAIASETPKRTTRDDPEHREQVRLFVWIDTEQDDPIIKQAYAVPNGGKRGPLTAKKMKAEGVRAGECDINLDVARGGYFGLRIELKTETGYCDPHQRARIEEHNRNGYWAIMCRGWEAARDALLAYVKLPPTEVMPWGTDCVPIVRRRDRRPGGAHERA